MQSKNRIALHHSNSEHTYVAHFISDLYPLYASAICVLLLHVVVAIIACCCFTRLFSHHGDTASEKVHITI